MTKYSKDITKRITSLIRSDSYTIDEICKMVGISRTIYHRWQEEKVEFVDAIKKAESDRMQFFVAEAKKSLLKKLQGYTVEEKHTVYVNSGKKDDGGKSIPTIKEQKVVNKHILPDTAAIIFTLVNGDPDNWKNRQNSELTGKGGKDLIPEMDFSQLSNEDLKAYHALLKKLNKK